MRSYRPIGTALYAWESDLLKVRALEMVLVLFYVQDLREFILHSIDGTQRVRALLGDQTVASKLIEPAGKAPGRTEGKKIDRARALLVAEGVISQGESDELFALMDYRNSIAHAVHKLTGDLGPNAHIGNIDPDNPITFYDYSAAKRAKALSEKIQNGMAKSFILSVELGSLQFEPAERTYLTEVKRLKNKVNKAIEKANKTIADTNRVIQAIPRSVLASLQPTSPTHTQANGSLTLAGRECTFALFDAGATPLAVAYLMRISLRSSKLAYRRWDDRSS